MNFRTSLIFASGLALAAFTLKLANLELPENFSLFGALAMFSGCFLRGRLAWLLPVAVLALTDCVGHLLNDRTLGLYDPITMIFNYGGFAAMSGIGMLLRKDNNLLVVGVATLVGTSLFFLISNFGCWIDPRMAYPTTFTGLSSCYTAAIPFARGSFSSDLVATLAMFSLVKVYCAFGAAREVESIKSRSVAS